MFEISKTQPVMMIEDNDDDYEATLRALRACGSAMQENILRFDNGDEALDYLRRQGQYKNMKDAPRPGVILLDLNMPGLSGREVLGDIKGSKELRDIPVIILTTSDNEKDVETCYDLGANTYVKKPVNIDSYYDAIKKLSQYWFDLAILPRGAGKIGTENPDIFKF